VLLFYYALKIFFGTEDTDKKTFSITMFFGIIGYMTISFFSFPKERIFHNVFLMLIAACVISTYHKLFPIRKKITQAKVISLHVLLLVLLGVCVFVGYNRLGSEIHSKKALSARKIKAWEQVIYEIDKADSWFYNMDPASTPLSWYRGMANFSLGRTLAALEDFKKGSEIHPNHVHVLNNLGTCYALVGEYESALEWYQRVLAISPRFEETLVNLSVVYYRLERYEEAQETLLLRQGTERNAG